MKFSDKEKWDITLKAQTSDYGKEIMRYAECWANLMENEIKNGKTLRQIADVTSHKADTNGLSGSMYNMAVIILVGTWIYGKELNALHNKSGGEQGKQATKEGKTLNYTSITIS